MKKPSKDESDQINKPKIQSEDSQTQTDSPITSNKGIQTQSQDYGRLMDPDSEEFYDLVQNECELRMKDQFQRQKKLEQELAQSKKTIARLQKLRECARLRQMDLCQEANLRMLRDQANLELEAWKDSFHLDWIIQPQDHAREEKRKTDEMLKKLGVHEQTIIQGLTATVMFLWLGRAKNNQMVVKQTGDMLYRWFVDSRLTSNLLPKNQTAEGHLPTNEPYDKEAGREERLVLLRLMVERVAIMCQAWWLHHESKERILDEDQHHMNHMSPHQFRNGNQRGNQGNKGGGDGFVLSRRESSLQRFKRNQEAFRLQIDQCRQSWGVLQLGNIFSLYLGGNCMFISAGELAWVVDQFRQGLQKIIENNWEQPKEQRQEAVEEQDGVLVNHGMRQ
eukprot:TRINITY_DN4231_c1_g1_i11.p1 TRINITY_DN4231_c1_g1~~TRINITY_DN4231_c1_g1_i11.p1  ORF type:complete len:392 (-),score=51.35 TRINITY_DN4231_c1_g1_i11:792-1967(-)